MGTVLDFNFEGIDGEYILIPKKVLRQCEKLTRQITISSNLPSFNDKKTRQIKSFQSAVDYLQKNNVEVTSDSLANVLQITPDMVQQVLDLAIELKHIEKTDNNTYIIKLKGDKEKIEKQPSNFKKALSLFYSYYMGNIQKKPIFCFQDRKVLQDLIKVFTIEELEKLFEGYFKLNNKFLKDQGFPLKFVSANANKILNGKVEKIDFTNSSGYTMSDEQLKMYLEGLNNNKYTGKEEWEKDYLNESKKRGLR